MSRGPQIVQVTSTGSRENGGGEESEGPGNEVQTTVIDVLRPGMSPRATEDKEHILRLAQTESTLPPILVHRQSMRIIDGVHRLKAAILRGQDEINVVFFDGSEEDAFIHAVHENVTHGLPLALADRKSAAERIISSHSELSDRAIATYTGLAAKTVAALRRSSSGESHRSNTRKGLDGRVRPLDAAEGRRRAAEVIEKQPDASLREIARLARISLGTAHDVRWRMDRGEDPVPQRPPRERCAAPEADHPALPEPELDGEHETLLRRLSKDPALRQTDQGRRLLRLFYECSVAAKDWSTLVNSVPPHCTGIAAGIAERYADRWRLAARALRHRENLLP